MTYKNNKRIERFQAYAGDNPLLYKFGVVGLVLMGYVYMFFIAVLLAGAAALLIFLLATSETPKDMIKLVLPLLGLLLIGVKALWIKVPEPYGISLEGTESEKLFKLIDELRISLRVHGIHKVLINHNFNATLVQRPMFGFFGPSRNHLVIGLPLMISFSPKELKALLAHEFAHVSPRNRGIINWAYRTRERWLRISEEFEDSEKKAGIVYRWIFKWYVPLLRDYTLAFLRTEEFNADILAAKAAGGDSTASALVKGSVDFDLLEEVFWPSVFEKANYLPNPPSGVFYDLKSFLREGNNRDDREKYLESNLKLQTESGDMYPSLSERLNLLKQEGRLSEDNDVTSVEAFLGEGWEDITGILNGIWKESAMDSWRDRNKFILDANRRSIEIRNKAREESLTMEEKWELCYLTEEIRDSREALKGYEAMVNEYPDFPPASFAYGRLLLDRKEEKGIEYIEMAMREDHEFVIEGCRLIHNYYYDLGKEAEAKEYYKRAIKHSELLDLADKERNVLEFRNIYLHHGLTGEEARGLTEQLSKYPEIAEAYLVKKEVQYLKDKDLYALGLVLKMPWYSTKKGCRNFVDRIAEEIEFKEETLIAYLNYENIRLKKIMMRVEGARIYTRSDK